MKTIEKILLQACFYTVLITLLFFSFVTLSNFADPKISFAYFLIIFLFGMAIALANMILDYQKLHIFFRIIIHYIVLLTTFSVVFINLGNISVQSASAVFVAIFIFTFLYLIVFLVSLLIKKLVGKIDSKLPATGKKPTKKSDDYQPRFK